MIDRHESRNLLRYMTIVNYDCQVKRMDTVTEGG